jgi:hypothetical protein
MTGKSTIKAPEHKNLLLLIGFLFCTHSILFPVGYPERQAGKPYFPESDSWDKMVGERLFHGLAATASGSTVNCASCHNTMVIDTLNWNPSALDIAIRTSGLDSLSFADLLLNPVTARSSEVHEGLQLTGEEMLFIRSYLDDLIHTGLQKTKPVITGIVIFFALILLFLVTLTDLIFIKYLKKNYIHMAVLLVTSVWITNILIEEGRNLGRSQDYAPLQPVKFSHKVHAGDFQIDCMHCHTTAEFGKSAGIPSANMCMNCHVLIRDGAFSGRFEINKIHMALDSATLIEWIRVHRLPDHVFFSHAQHVGVAKLDCRECHGPVEEMHVLKQFADLSMGWCLDCHRTSNVNFLANDYYGMTFREYHDKIVSGNIESVTVAQLGGTDCMKCHY